PALPIWGTERVTSGNKRVLPVASDAADSPYRTAVRVCGRGPCCHAGRIVYWHAYQPAMKRTAIRHTAVADIKNVAYDAECRSLLLNRRIKLYAVVCSCRLNVHRPARVDIACVHIQGKDEVFLGRATVRRDHRVQKERARSEIDNGRASDTHG